MNIHQYSICFKYANKNQISLHNSNWPQNKKSNKRNLWIGKRSDNETENHYHSQHSYKAIKNTKQRYQNTRIRYINRVIIIDKTYKGTPQKRDEQTVNRHTHSPTDPQN